MDWFKQYRRQRTLILAIVATATFVSAAIFSFGVEPQVMVEIFTYSLVVLFIVISAALLVVLLWQKVLKKVWNQCWEWIQRLFSD